MYNEGTKRLSNTKDPLAPDPIKLNDYTHSKKVSNYLIGEIIGKGAFATVYEGLHATTTEKVAVKVTNKALCTKDNYIKKHLRREGKILQQLRHPNIVQILEIMETENSYYLVLELCTSNMMTKILKKTKLTEMETRFYMKQLILAVDYLHRCAIMHRDLKVENILLTKEDVLKVADFGVSIQLSGQNYSQAETIYPEKDNLNERRHLCKTQCGSPAYAAPEVLSRSLYEYSADVWSIGINMFAMMTGKLPFTVKPFNVHALKEKMIKGEMNELPEDVSNDCRNLLKRFLNPESFKRITLKEAMEHPWFNSKDPILWNHGPNGVEINSALILYMDDNLGFRRSDTIKSLIQKLSNSSHATYYLLMKKAHAYCQFEQLSLSKWLYNYCSKSATDPENIPPSKVNHVNEIKTFKSSLSCEILPINTKNEEPDNQSYNTSIKPSNAVSAILTRRQSLNMNTIKSTFEKNIKCNKSHDSGHVLPHINDIKIPYLTLINPPLSKRTSTFNIPRPYTTKQVYNQRRLSITDDIWNMENARIHSNFGQNTQFLNYFNRRRRFSMGFNVSFRSTSIKR